VRNETDGRIDHFPIHNLPEKMLALESANGHEIITDDLIIEVRPSGRFNAVFVLKFGHIPF